MGRGRIQTEPQKEVLHHQAFTNRYPDAEAETITPENYGEWAGVSFFWVDNLQRIYMIFSTHQRKSSSIDHN